MEKRIRIALIAIAALAVTLPARAGHHAAPGQEFSATSHRRFDDVERWSKIFDDPARDQWQKPAEVVAALGLKPADTVADLGSGTGDFLAYLTRAVGDEGGVFAVEG